MRTETQEFNNLLDYEGSESALADIEYIDIRCDIDKVYEGMVRVLGEETTDDAIEDYLADYAKQVRIEWEGEQEEDEYEQKISWDEIIYWDER